MTIGWLSEGVRKTLLMPLGLRAVIYSEAQLKVLGKTHVR